MRRALKFLAIVVGALALAIVAIIVLVPTDRIAQIAADQVKAATGRTLTMTDVSPSFFPVVGVETGPVTLSNAEWGEADHLVSATSARVGVELIPLLSGDIRFTEVRLVDPVISLEVAEDGTPNWAVGADGGAGESGGEGGGFVQAISLDEAVIRNGRVSYVDRQSGMTAEVAAINARGRLKALDAPLTLEGDAVWNGEEAEVKLTFATPAAAMAGERIAIDLDLASSLVELTLKGDAAPPAEDAPPMLKADFSVKAASPAAAFLWAMGRDAPPELIGISALDVAGKAQMNAEGATVSLTGGATRGGQAASVDLTATAGPDWATAQAFDVALKAGVGDLAALSYEGGVALGGALPALNGRYSVAAADPAAAAAWATGAAPDALKGLGDLALDGAIEMNDSALSATATGGATRDGARATVDLKAASGADWATLRAFDLDVKADVAGVGRVAYVGRAGAGADGPALDGRYSLAAANPAKAVAWAGGGSPEALAGLSDLAFDGTVKLSAKGLNATAKGGATRDGKEARIDLAAAAGADWMTRRAFDVTLDARLGQIATLTFAGAAAAPPDGAPRLDGRVTLDVERLKALAAFAGVETPKGAKGAYRSLTLAGDVRTTGPNAFGLDLARLTLDDISAKGRVAADLSAAPRISAELTTGPLDLRPYMTGGDAGPAGPGWSREKIDLAGLGAFSGDFKIRAESVALPPDVSLGVSDITAKLEAGRLDLTIRELGFYGGGVTGEVSVNGLKGNALSANVSASAVRLLPMLKALADVGLIQGTGRAVIDVTGGGASLHDIMNSLDGKGSMKLTDGAIVGYDIAGMVRNVTSAFTGDAGGRRNTDFSEVSGSFNIKKGVMSNADFQFLGPLLRVVGAGTVDLGAQTVNFRMTPKAVASLKGQGGSLAAKGVAFPLLISGPWSNPSIRPDLEAGITELLKDPAGAIDALKGVAGGVDGGAAGAVGAALGAATEGLSNGGAGPAGAASTIDKAIRGEASPSDLLNALSGGALVTDDDMKRARQAVKQAKDSGDKKALREARQNLKALRERKETQDRNARNPIGGLVEGLLKN